jgi:outer membrane immunogenic protein
MKIINKIALILSSLIISAPALAGPYISGQVGAFGYGEKNNPIENLFDNDDEIRATGRLAGGYTWDVNDCLKVGLEAGVNGFEDVDSSIIFADFNSINVIDLEYSRWSLDALAVVDYQATQKFDLFAKAGPAYVREKVAIDTFGVEFSRSHGTVVPKAIVGVGYDVTNNVNLNLSLSHEFKRDNQNSIFDAVPSTTSALVGLQYNFS